MAIAKALFGLSKRQDRRIDQRMQSAALEILLAGEVFRVLDWSLSGALLADYFGPCGTGDEVVGHVQISRNGNSFPFKGVVVRRNAATGELALNFTDISASGFAALEALTMDRLGL